jgi:hypothetical protein
MKPPLRTFYEITSKKHKQQPDKTTTIKQGFGFIQNSTH